MSQHGDSATKAIEELRQYLMDRADRQAAAGHPPSEDMDFMMQLVGVLDNLHLRLQLFEQEYGIPDAMISPIPPLGSTRPRR